MTVNIKQKEVKKIPKLRFPEFSGELRCEKLKKFGYFYYGKSAPKYSVSKDAKTPCVRYGELYSTYKECIKSIRSYTKMAPQKLRFSKGGEVLVPRVGEDPLDFANCSYLPIPNVAIGEMISVYNTKEDGLFMAYYMNATLKKEFARVVEGASVSNLYYRYLEEIEISIPGFSEQQKIADFLGSVDEWIEDLQKKKECLVDYKKGMMQKIFSQEIRFRDDNGKKFSEWEEKKLGDVAKFWNGKAHEQTINENGKYIVVNSKFISSNGEVKKYSGYQISPLKKDDIAIVMSDIPKGKAIGKCFLINEDDNYTLNQRIGGIKSKEIISSFLIRILNRNRYFLKFDNGVSQTNLRKDEVLRFPVVFPSISEQQKISEFLTSLDSLIELKQQQITQAKEWKKSLMQQMFV